MFSTYLNVKRYDKMPYSKKAKYKHNRQRSPSDFVMGSFKTVPLNHTKYKGKKYKGYNKSGTTAKAVVGTLKSGKKSVIQSILIKKKK